MRLDTRHPDAPNQSLGMTNRLGNGGTISSRFEFRPERPFLSAQAEGLGDAWSGLFSLKGRYNDMATK